jgi:hypothetical protein
MDRVGKGFPQRRRLSIPVEIWLFRAFDTAGEVLDTRVRCIGLVMIADNPSEGHHALPDADRTDST